MSRSEARHFAAALINAHGELCAEVVLAERAHQTDVFRVTCTRYRDGTGSATYELNARTGAVK